MITSYTDLTVWQKSFALAVEIYRATRSFARDEFYSLGLQMCKSAISIPSNIAEGYSRNRKKEYARFLQVAFGSGAELETQMLIAKEVGLLSSIDFERLNALLSEIMKMLNTLIRRIKTSA